MSRVSQRTDSRRDAVPSMQDKVELIDTLCARAYILPVITIEREEYVLPLADAWLPGRP